MVITIRGRRNNKHKFLSSLFNLIYAQVYDQGCVMGALPSTSYCPTEESISNLGSPFNKLRLDKDQQSREYLLNWDPARGLASNFSYQIVSKYLQICRFHPTSSCSPQLITPASWLACIRPDLWARLSKMLHKACEGRIRVGFMFRTSAYVCTMLRWTVAPPFARSAIQRHWKAISLGDTFMFRQWVSKNRRPERIIP